MIDYTLTQTAKEDIDFHAFSTKNTFWGAYYRRDAVDGKTQEWYFPLGKVSPQFSQSSPGGASSNAQKFTALVNDSAVTLAAALLASLGAYNTATVTVAAEAKFAIVETT
jgi:hypothetical protein